MLIALIVTAILAATPEMRLRSAPAPPEPITREPKPAEISRTEWIIAGAAGVLLAVLRWLSTFSHPWNTDEPQHLHVVWAWTAGLLPYRDLFDNHTPLFHVLCAPLLLWFGERADIVVFMRLAMIPLLAFSLWCVYRLGASLYSQRAGLFAALLAALYPSFFFHMGEFRTDVLWVALWLGALVVLLTGRMTRQRLFFTGLILGAAFGVSMKTTLLLLTLLAAGALTGVAYWYCGPIFSEERNESAAPIWHYPAAVVAGLLLVPGAIVAFFAANGALQPLYHCVIQHNTLPGDNLGALILKHLHSTSMLTLIPVLACAAAMLPMLGTNLERGLRRLFLLLATGLFYPLLHGFWPVITPQDYLPWYPLLPISLAPALWWAGDALAARSKAWIPRFALPVLLLAAEVAGIFQARPIFSHPNDRRVEALARVLRLADPGDYVLDAKGETIFRPRPCYLVMESLTRRQLENGTIDDDVIPRLIATRTAVVRSSGRVAPEVHAFIEENYIALEHVRVLGKFLPPARNGVINFDVTIPERYAFETKKGEVGGTIDGDPVTASRWLDAGPHELKVAQSNHEVVLIWARAKERGLSLFSPLKRIRNT